MTTLLVLVTTLLLAGTTFTLEQEPSLGCTDAYQPSAEQRAAHFPYKMPELAVHPTEDLLAIAGFEQGVWVYDLETFTLLCVFPTTTGFGTNTVEWLGDSYRLITLDSSRQFLTYDAREGTLVSIWTTPNQQSIDDMQSSPDGRWVAVLSDFTHLDVIDTQTGLIVFQDSAAVANTGTRDQSLAWSSDSRQLSYTRRPGVEAAPRWRVVREAVTWEMVTTLESDNEVNAAQWSPNNSQLALASYRKRWLYDTRSWAQIGQLPDWQHIYTLVWSPDSSQLLVGGGDHLVLMDAQTGAVLETLIAESNDNLPLVVYDAYWFVDGATVLVSIQRGGRPGIGTELWLYDTTTWQVIERSGCMVGYTWLKQSPCIPPPPSPEGQVSDDRFAVTLAQRG